MSLLKKSKSYSHPELVSGSLTLNIVEMLKQVQHDRDFFCDFK